MKDIFDLTNIKDLPKHYLQFLQKKERVRKEGIQDHVLFLFDIKNPLTVREIIVGLYRKNKEQTTIRRLYPMLSSLKKHGLIDRIGPRTYAKSTSIKKGKKNEK